MNPAARIKVQLAGSSETGLQLRPDQIDYLLHVKILDQAGI